MTTMQKIKTDLQLKSGRRRTPCVPSITASGSAAAGASLPAQQKSGRTRSPGRHRSLFVEGEETPCGPHASECLAPHNQLLTIQQAADFIGVHYQTVRNWMKRNQIEYR